MLVVKPYGKTVIQSSRDASRKREILDLTLASAPIISVDEFARVNSKLILAQWISVLDKIIRKPIEGCQSDVQKHCLEIRVCLGNACWERVEARLKRAGLSGQPGELEALKKRWDWKIQATQPRRKGNSSNKENLKGRWYETFGGPDICNIEAIQQDAEKIAGNIETHLYEHAYRLIMTSEQQASPQQRKTLSSSNKRKGYIAYRNCTIEQNVAVLRDDFTIEIDDDLAEKYFSLSDTDIACAIKQAIEDKQTAQQKQKNKEALFTWESPYITAMRHCREFKQTLPIDDQELLAFHQQVKELYKYLLQGKKIKSIDYRLPENKETLLQLLKARTQNKNINGLIRLGKIIHYETMGGAKKQNTQFCDEIIDKEKIGHSVFWSSEGQTRIKQSEAFVRVWRSAIAFAARNLKDWIDPKDTIKGDILLSKQYIKDNFCPKAFDRKWGLLFGGNHGLMEKSNEEKKKLVLFYLDKLTALRHASFHFKKISDFSIALFKTSENEDKNLFVTLENLYRTDSKRLQKRPIEIMEAIKADHTLHLSELSQLCDELLPSSSCMEVQCDSGSPFPLPRLARVLNRVKDGWKPYERTLPPYHTAQEREQDLKLNCQYGLLKLLYEGPFAAWLAQQSDLSPYIKIALEHTTKQAQAMHAKDPFNALIVAKASHLLGQNIEINGQDFFFQLSAATASEMRVQKGYQSNPQAAQEQSEYIEKFKHDVVALAFEAYLKEKNLEFLGEKSRTPFSQRNDGVPSELNENTHHLEKRRQNLPSLKFPEAWAIKLYAVLHLLPVEMVGELRQQLKKWQIVTHKARSGSVVTKDQAILSPAGQESFSRNEGEKKLIVLLGVFDLYLAMHDAQFVGEEISFCDNHTVDPLKQFYEKSEDFDRLFKQENSSSMPFLSKRGVREMLRFGQLCLYELYKKHAILSSLVENWIKSGETISDDQNRLQLLYWKWTRTKAKKEWLEEYLKNYKTALKKVEAYRHHTAQVLLQDHLHLHRFFLRLMGRLIDYAGLWERDLYFVLLALNYHHSDTSTQKTFFNSISKEAFKKIKKGQIVEAFALLPPSPLRQSLERYFALTWTAELSEKNCSKALSYEEQQEQIKKQTEILQEQNPCIWIRNRIAHLNLLTETPLCLINELRYIRRLMAYDRKLKNSVTKAFKALFEKEGINISFTMDNNEHQLNVESVQAKTIDHLGDKKIKESLRSDFFVQMVKELVDPTKAWPKNR
ncbi:hypothetical protein COMNV_00294 [Commensalibacter sp. Nvir]|uniref:type VI-A CRISPR-associated RNA-guided ribonuclease Cas13a n=1 Tax=Commensalibacter sp. Nvir TaxID=3069817 RepID=UPI002D6FBED8|nr:hypothetical protein COMNV_00294 [Commensalibacter sp. Nvir]